MGWAERDYAKWTDEERERFYGHSAGRGGSRSIGGPVFRRGVGPAVVASGLLLALGHFPAGHPILPMLHFSLPGRTGSAASVRSTGTISTPASATLGSTLTFRGTAPPGDGPVAVDGSYDGGRTWQTLSTVESAGRRYAAQITLNQRGLLRIRIVFSDGSAAVGSTVVS